jgi:hypothetical protein
LSRTTADRPRHVATAGAWRAAGLLLIAVAGGATETRAEDTGDAVAVTPYRPTVSTPAALSAPGWLEIEAGWQRFDLPGSDRRDSIPYTLKLALSDDWGIRIGGESGVRAVGAQRQDVSGWGDTAVILKRRFAVGSRAAFGLELGAVAPTAQPGLHSGSGATDYLATGIYSADLGTAWHADLNVGVTRLGTAGPAESRYLGLAAAALSLAVSPRWQLVGEWSGTRQAGVGSTGQLLVAASYGAGRRLVLDAGIARGMTALTPGWTIFFGGTALVAKVF